MIFEYPLWFSFARLNYVNQFLNLKTRCHTFMQCMISLSLHSDADSSGNFPLHYAAKAGAVALVDYLWTLGADLNAKNESV
jgi:ankyrin repeat protein